MNMPVFFKTSFRMVSYDLDSNIQLRYKEFKMLLNICLTYSMQFKKKYHQRRHL